MTDTTIKIIKKLRCFSKMDKQYVLILVSMDV